ncbi:MAG: LysE family translocator [Tagaea sp.]|nr:LysE family translocator [Tagaea sp.]
MNDPLLWALLGFALTTSCTPGPNNAMLTASGANFGFRRAIPHMLGVMLGFPVMVLAIGVGLGAVFAALPWLHAALKYAGAAYLLYLAWRVATAGRSDGPDAAKPIGFFEAAGFQWVNPKAWIMAVGALAAYTDPDANAWLEAARVALAFLLSGVVSCTMWCGFGVAIGRLLKTERAFRTFNFAMALALVASLIPVFVV